ncbi:MAG TPA: Pycsar system effector family protein [Saprospiraceae bacterium]|nr:Pycsar system effector family protein [Saprospiraceae bacterium]
MEPNIIKHRKEGRSRETLFRVAYQHQGQLLQIADYKANLIISVSTMIISGIVATIGFGIIYSKGQEEKFAQEVGYLHQYGYMLAAPAIVIVIACLLALINAIQAARPKFLNPNSNKQHDNRSSLLFFRSIADHSQLDYLTRMKDLLDNEEDIFEQMTIDLYNQGVVLKKKYDLLRNAYTILMYGFVASVIAFLLMLITAW